MAGRPRSARIDLALREAALSTFVDHGLSDFTFDEVARRAGVSRTALYRRWSNREALLLDALRAWRIAYDDRTRDMARPLQELIELLADRAATAMRDPFARALLRRLLTLGPEGKAVLEGHLVQTVAAQRAALTRAIVEAQRHGEVRGDIDPANAQDAVMGGLICKLLSGEADSPGFDASKYVGDLFHLVGLAPQISSEDAS